MRNKILIVRCIVFAVSCAIGYAVGYNLFKPNPYQREADSLIEKMLKRREVQQLNRMWRKA